MEKRKINLTIDGRSYQIKEGKTILESCKELGISIPSLCYLKDISSNASCGICVVEVKGAKNLVRSCVTSASEGMEIKTHTPALNQARITNLQLLFIKNWKMKLQKVSLNVNNWIMI